MLTVLVAHMINDPVQDAAMRLASPPSITHLIPEELLQMLAGWLTASPIRLLTTAGVGVVALVGLILAAKRLLAARAPQGQPRPRGEQSRANRWWYAVAVIGVSVSLNTQYRFYGDYLKIVDLERWVVFSGQELALLACAQGMRANVRAKNPDGTPGSPGMDQTIAWALCAFAGFAAFAEADSVVGGVVRVVLGPVLAMVAIHRALNIETRNKHRRSRVTRWTRLRDEMLEVVFSWIGLANDSRDAVTRRADRAARRSDRRQARAARRLTRLAAGRYVMFRNTRALRAIYASGVAHDPNVDTRITAETTAALHYLRDLTARARMMTPAPSPRPADALPVAPEPAAIESAPAPTAPEPTPVTPPDGPGPTRTPAMPDRDAEIIALPSHTERPTYLDAGMEFKAAVFAYLDQQHPDDVESAKAPELGALFRSWGFSFAPDRPRAVLREYRTQHNRSATGDATGTSGE